MTGDGSMRDRLVWALWACAMRDGAHRTGSKPPLTLDEFTAAVQRGLIYRAWSYELQADAVLAEMREPTEAMGYAGMIARNGDSIRGWPDEQRRAAYEALGDIGAADRLAANPARWSMPAYRAMIDAAKGTVAR